MRPLGRDAYKTEWNGVPVEISGEWEFSQIVEPLEPQKREKRRSSEYRERKQSLHRKRIKP